MRGGWVGGEEPSAKRWDKPADQFPEIGKHQTLQTTRVKKLPKIPSSKACKRGNHFLAMYRGQREGTAKRLQAHAWVKRIFHSGQGCKEDAT